MKKVILSMLCLLLGVGVCAAKKRDRKAEPFVNAREVTVTDAYNELEVMDMIHVFLEEDRDPSMVRIETEGISADEVQVEAESGILTLSCTSEGQKAMRKGNWKRNRARSINVYVGVGALDKFICTGMATIHTEATIEQPPIQIDITGMGDAEMNLACDRLLMTLSGMSDFKGMAECRDEARIDLSGMSDCRIEGETKDFNLYVGGMSDYKGQMFEASGKTRCTVSGMSDAKVNCTGTIELELDGWSGLKLSGDPQVLSSSVMKGSSLKMKK